MRSRACSVSFGSRAHRIRATLAVSNVVGAGGSVSAADRPSTRIRGAGAAFLLEVMTMASPGRAPALAWNRSGPADTFTGEAWYDAIAGGAQWARMRVSTVWFAPGARTAWHTHPRGQTLCVTEGRGRAQSR